MGKKKGSGGKKGKKSGKTAGGSASKSDLDMNTKEYFLVQIKDLEYRLERYQRRCDELVVERANFKEKFDQMVEDRNDIVNFWKLKADKTEEENKEFEERATSLQLLLDDEKQKFDIEKSKWRQELEETKERLNEDINSLQKKVKLQDNEEPEDTDEVTEKLAKLEEHVKEQDEKHNKIIYDLEKKAVIDKDRLKKEMISRVNTVAAEFRKVSNKQMDETTKRAIRENASIVSQLRHKSDKIIELLAENKELTKTTKEQKQMIEILEAMQKDLTYKNSNREKIIKSLTEKCKEQAIEVERMGFLTLREDIEKAYESKAEECELQKVMLEKHEKEVEKLTSELHEIKKSLRAEKRAKEKLEKTLSETASSIQLALKHKDDTDEDEYPVDRPNYLERRNNVLENILLVLVSAGDVGLGPDPKELNKPSKGVKTVQSKPEGRANLESSLPLTKRNVNMPPHYKIGDLGLVPRDKQKLPSNWDRMRVLSATTRLGGLRRVLTHSVAVQTVSAPKAMFYADQLISSKRTGKSPEAIMRDPSGDAIFPNRGARFVSSPVKRIPGKAY